MGTKRNSHVHAPVGVKLYKNVWNKFICHGWGKKKKSGFWTSEISPKSLFTSCLLEEHWWACQQEAVFKFTTVLLAGCEWQGERCRSMAPYCSSGLNIPFWSEVWKQTLTSLSLVAWFLRCEIISALEAFGCGPTVYTRC